MPPTHGRASSVDPQVRHQHSSSESWKSPVPMWDSSDPDRAPPPLPINPGTNTPGSSPVKPNTSATVAAAAQALVDRARENLAAPYVTNPPPERLSDRSPSRTPQHKRLQSLQTNGLKDFRQLHHVQQEPRISRSTTPSSELDSGFSPSSSRSATPTPSGRHESKDGSPSKGLRRPASQPLMIENTPPSSSERVLGSPLADMTNASTPRTLQNFESIHSQMLNLTSIAGDLQKEMAALSRRSKDNASDLIALKEATGKRDEDIRVSLRDIASGQKEAEARHLKKLLDAPPVQTTPTRSTSSLGTAKLFDDERRSRSPRRTTRPTQALPLLLSNNAHDTDSDVPSSPSSGKTFDSGPGSALLEKIVRDMSTKDGLERVVQTLTKVVERSGQDSTAAIRTVLEAVESMRDQSNMALVKHEGRARKVSSETLKPVNDQLSRGIPPQQTEQHSIVNDEMLHLLKKIKDSIFQSGGMTGEMKSLIKELRGEVLGMGRELGRKLEVAEKQRSARELATESPLSREELSGIIEDNLADLRVQMESVIQTRRRESAGSAVSRTTIDSSEMLAVMKHAIAEHTLDLSQQSREPAYQGLDADAILNAVKEAYEAYKPEVEVQQFGLERDEILQCLKEGLEDYQTSKSQSNDSSRETIMEAVQDAMKHFQAPKQTSDAAEIKDEVMEAVRESLEEFKQSGFGLQRSDSGDLNRREVLDAVREGLGVFRKEGAREIEISPDDLYDAVKAGLNGMENPFGEYGNQVIQSLHEIVDGMRVEFKQYSEANGRDTEQVLDAMKDGLETLRAEIESYVDRAQDVTGRDEIISTLHHELDGLRTSLDQMSAKDRSAGAAADHSDLVQFIKGEFENLHEVVASHAHSSEAAEQHKHEIIRSLDAGFSQVSGSAGSRGLEDSNEEQLEALKLEFEQLKEAILNGSAAHRDDIIEHVRESMDRLPMGSSSRGLDDNRDMMSTLQEELQSFRDSMQAPTLYNGPSTQNSSEILEAIRESMTSIRSQMSAEQSDSAGATLGVIREELDSFRDALGGSLMLNTPGVDKEAVIEAVREALEARGLDQGSSEAVDAVRAELENFRQSFGNAMVPSAPASVNTEEIVNAVRSALDDMKTDLAGQVTLASPSSKPEIDALLERLSNDMSDLKGDISRFENKPVDMTASYEILDRIKDGFADIRTDLDNLKAGHAEIVLAGSTQRQATDDTAEQATLKRTDLDRLEVLLAQVQIKVEAMDQNMQSQPEVSMPNAATKDDIASVETFLRELQVGVAAIQNSTQDSSTTRSSKEDIEAIETLLQNTKAKIDDSVIPGLESNATREQVDGIEAIVRLTSEAVDSLSSKLEDGHTSKDDLAGVALLVNEATTAISDIKGKLELADFTDVASKSSMDAVETLCSNIKAKLEEMPEDAPSKTDIEELRDLISDVRDSQTTMKERYDDDITVTAQAFDDRKQEASKITEQIEDLRGFIEETRDHLKSRMKRGNEDVRALDDILQTMEEKIDDVPNQFPNIDDLKSVFQSEFEKAHATLDELKLGNDSNSAVIWEKFEEHRAGTVADMVAKLDERFNEIMASHDEQKRVLGDTTSSMNERSTEQSDVLAGTRAMAEELKVSIDAFGAAVTGISPALEEATQKMSEDSQTVFNKVEEMYTKIDDANVDSKTNHQLTRDDIAKAFDVISKLQEQSTTNHPEIMSSFQALTAVVNQLAERSSTSQEDMKSHIDEGLRRFDVPQIDGPKATAKPASAGGADEERIHGKLDELLNRGISTSYDDAHVRGKLDELIGHVAKPSSAPEHLERLDAIHQKITQTSAEVAAFLASQTKQITAGQEDKSRDAEQAALDLQKRESEKEAVQGDIEVLRSTKDSLAAEVEQLKSEHEKLMATKLHLSADVSSLETALKIRREELHMMDERADTIERRIIEGLMDHSRAALLITKTQRNPPNMNLKRVTSNRSNVTSSTATAATATPSSVVNNGVDMAMKARADRKKRSPENPSARRIASLNQINTNVLAGGKHLISAAPKASGFIDLKRSQSVKNPALRKSSWRPQERPEALEFDKENDVLPEESEIDHNTVDHSGSRRQTLDNSSLGARSASYGGRSQGTSALSYMTGTDVDRRTSYGSVVRSALGPRSSLAASIHEEDEEDEDAETDDDTSSVRRTRDDDPQEEWENHGEEEGQLAHGEGQLNITEEQRRLLNKKGLMLARHDGYHTDSGLGSDLPTATFSGGSDYFK